MAKPCSQSWVFNADQLSLQPDGTDRTLSLCDRVPPGRYALVRSVLSTGVAGYVNMARAHGFRGLIFVLGDDRESVDDLPEGRDKLVWAPSRSVASFAWQRHQQMLLDDVLPHDPLPGQFPGPYSARNGDLLVFGANGFVFASWMSRVPDVKQLLDITAGQLSLLLLAISIGSLCGLPLAGRIAHRLGASTTVRLGALFALPGIVLAALAVEMRAPLLIIAPAMVLIDAMVRLLPGVLNDGLSAAADSFSPEAGVSGPGLLDHPHYTRPEVWRGETVPAPLMSGDHGRIAMWRRKQALKRSLLRRPDLLDGRHWSKQDLKLLDEIRQEQKAVK